MNASRTLLAAAIATTLASFAANAAIPPVDPKGEPALQECGNIGWGGQPLSLQHFDKVIFSVNDVLIAADPADQPALAAAIRKGQVYDIKVRDNPRTVADLKGKVLTFLNAALTPANRGLVKIIDVDYAVACVAQTATAPN